MPTSSLAIGVALSTLLGVGPLGGIGMTAGDASSIAGGAAAAGILTDGPVSSADPLSLDELLAPDGTYTGADGVAGIVDLGGWTLVSDLAAGEAPPLRADGHRPGGSAAVRDRACGGHHAGLLRPGLDVGGPVERPGVLEWR